MSNSAKFSLAIAIAISSISAPSYAAKKPVLTPMELQALQSKEFEASKSSVFASTMSVFQDLGYTINSADIETGFITASSPVKDKTNFWSAMAGVASQGLTKATAFIEQGPNGYTKIRLNFVSSIESSSSYGQRSQADKPILDPLAYRAAWEKIDEALFVRNALAKPASPQTPSNPPATPASPTQQGATQLPSVPVAPSIPSNPSA
ncbi:MAG: hypothetical protein ACOYO0_05590 [Sandarakinorhabdus sp.]